MFLKKKWLFNALLGIFAGGFVAIALFLNPIGWYLLLFIGITFLLTYDSWPMAGVRGPTVTVVTYGITTSGPLPEQKISDHKRPGVYHYPIPAVATYDETMKESDDVKHQSSEQMFYNLSPAPRPATGLQDPDFEMGPHGPPAGHQERKNSSHFQLAPYFRRIIFSYNYFPSPIKRVQSDPMIAAPALQQRPITCTAPRQSCPKVVFFHKTRKQKPISRIAERLPFKWFHRAPMISSHKLGEDKEQKPVPCIAIPPPIKRAQSCPMMVFSHKVDEDKKHKSSRRTKDIKKREAKEKKHKKKSVPPSALKAILN